MIRYAVAVATISCALSVAPLLAVTHRVTSTADLRDAVIGDGICAASNGDCTLRAAVQESNATGGRNTIRVAAGNYALTIAGADEDGALTGDLDITKDLVILGADRATTIISGSGLDRIFDAHPEVLHFAIARLTLRDGNVPSGQGGAIRARAAVTGTYPEFQMDDVSFLSNRARDGGAVATIAVDGSFPGEPAQPVVSIRHSSFDQNQASGNGGAIYQEFGHRTIITASTFGTAGGNTAGADGGAISSTSFQVGVEYCTLENNTAGEYGGAIHLDGYSGMHGIVSSTLATNHARNGGAIYTCCTSYAVNWFAHFSSSLFIGNSTLSANSADVAGGALFGSSGVHVRFSTLAGNAAPNAGGIFMYLGDASLTASILANEGANCGGNNFTYFRESVISDGSCAKASAELNTLNVNPLLGPLGNNGGLTETHALLEASPAIDRSTVSMPYDQRGVRRPYGAALDSGAFEFSPISAPPSNSLTLDVSQNPAFAGASVVLAATLQGGTRLDLAFYDGAELLGYSGPDGRLTLFELAPGIHQLTARYESPNLYYGSVSSPVVTLVVLPAGSTINSVPVASQSMLALMSLMLAGVGCWAALRSH